jgi:hypothetical protein
MRTPATILSLVLLAACASDTVDPSEWRAMDGQAKILYVKSLVGAEKVKDAKGGGGRDYSRPAEEYVAAIEAAYAAGDQRPAHEIFEGLEPAR